MPGASLPIAVALGGMGWVSAVLKAVFPARSHGFGGLRLWFSPGGLAVALRLGCSESCPEIKQGYPLNLSI